MLDLNKLINEQLKLAEKVIINDTFESQKTVGGADQSFEGESIISAIVVCDSKTLKVIEKCYAIAKAKMPYIAGFLAYREGPAIAEAFAKLEYKPDIMIFDGSGILHPRRCGLASHMGVLLDVPSIGVAKEISLGEINGKIIYVDKEARAEAVITKEHARPLYISPGHRISLHKSVELVKGVIAPPHKLPEPLHLAHRYANEIRDKLKGGELKTDIQK